MGDDALDYWRSRVPRNVAVYALPAAASALMYLFARHLLVYSNPQYQLLLLPALILGALAETLPAVAVSSVLMGALSAIVPPTFAIFDTAPLAGGIPFPIAASLVMFLLGTALIWARKHLHEAIGIAAALLVVGLVVANMVITAEFVNSQVARGSVPPNYELLKRPVPTAYEDDTYIFLNTYRDMGEGRGFYSSFRDAHRAYGGWGQDPPGVFGYRLPTAFWLWQVQPWGPLGIPRTLLGLEIIVLIGLTFALIRYLPLGVVATCVSGIAGYLIYFPTTAYALWIESWAVPFALGSLCAVLLAERSRHRSKTWWWVAAGLALTAMLVREQYVLLGLGGLVTSLVVPRLRRRRIWLPWAIAVGLFVVAWGLHARAVLSMSSPDAFTWQQFVKQWLNGGLAHLRACLAFGTFYISLTKTGSYAWAALGTLGIALAPRTIRWLLGLTAAGGALLALGFGSPTWVGYWGVFLTPYLLLGVPFAFGPLATPLGSDKVA